MKLRIFSDFSAPADAMEMLRAGTAGHELVLSQVPTPSVLSKPGPDPRLTSVNIAFGQPDPAAIEQAPKLRWIHISTSGITRYDNSKFRARMAERGVRLTNSASVYAEPCAVHALSFMLAQARMLPLALKTRVASDTPAWPALRDTCGTLWGETVLIVGYGAIGKRLAELLRPFGVKVIAYRRKARGDEDVPVITQEQLARTLAGDVRHIVNILPASEDTHRFFDAVRFSQVRPGAIFYNIGRGATVDQDALLAALRSGRLQAAWLDVTEPEPLPDGHPLWAELNCFITPHIAGGHTAEANSLVRHFLSNLDRFTRGEPLVDQVM